MEGRLLAKARQKLSERREEHRREEERRRWEVYDRVERIAGIDARLRGIMTELVGLALGNTRRSAEDMAAESLRLQDERRALLRSHGWPENYLDEIHDCPLCGDRGHNDDGSLCSCLMALYKKEQTLELSPLLRSDKECFENFRLSYYDAEGDDSPRKRMDRIFRICRSYAENFAPGAGSLLFTGAPGLGKTFLSAAIARVVADKGYSVAYDTVSAMLTVFEREKFPRGSEEEQAENASRLRQLMGCDLLILDDLGTEMLTAFSQSALYSLLDGRIRSGKSTIISTNLDRAAITERYGPQLSSRLSGEYQWLTFLGRDIRLLRKERG